jgi:hypothetical protein
VGEVRLDANKIGIVRRASADVTGLGVRTGTKFPNEQVRSMIGIVLVTHGRLAAEFRAALEHVAGPQKQIEFQVVDRHARITPGLPARPS